MRGASVPVTVVVGGQFGSEGKGKVAHYFARERKARYAVRVGGSNSGHTVIDDHGEPIAFRHLPTAAILPNTVCVIGPGSYIDVNVLLAEIDRIRLPAERLIIDPNAVIITEQHKQAEKTLGLVDQIGSTGSGTGAAVLDRIQRRGDALFAYQEPLLRPYCDFAQRVPPILRKSLNNNDWVLLEGTQGFGLSVLHSEYYPHVTSRDTTAAAFVSEAGLSPIDVSEIVLVIRSFPIRVAGDSGPLPKETNWESVSATGGFNNVLVERTTVTKKIRRVGYFDPDVVAKAISINQPTHIVLNHVDYLDSACHGTNQMSEIAMQFVTKVENRISSKVTHIGLGPAKLIDRHDAADVIFAQ